MEEVILSELQPVLASLTKEQACRLVVAYEPIWAIGTGNTASVEDALKASEVIRKAVEKQFDHAASRRTRVLYGGSVTSENAHSFHVEGIDGVLVGGASLKAESFAAIANTF